MTLYCVYSLRVTQVPGACFCINMRAAAQGCVSDRYTQIKLEFNVGICRFTLSITFFVNFSWGGWGRRETRRGKKQPQVRPR